MNATAFSEGLSARLHDEENGGLTENPYTPGTVAFTDWYRGYNTNIDEEP